MVERSFEKEYEDKRSDTELWHHLQARITSASQVPMRKANR